MKNLKKSFAVLLAIIILLLSLPIVSVSAADADMNYGRKMLSQMSNGSALTIVYDLLVQGVATLESAVYVPGNVTITHEEMQVIYKMFYSDYPEYFWIARGIPGFHGSYSDILEIYPIYVTDATGYGKFSNLETAKSQYNAKVAELTSGLDGKSDYEKAKILHDRLCETVTYTGDCNNHQNAYGALVEGKAVCNGYARAYQHLLKTAGIPAWYVSGSSRGEGHAWNLVKIDGSWYYSDATWDDTDDDFEYFENCYEYFNITTSQLLQDHTIDAEYVSLVPTATATAANYYVKENLIFSSFNKNQLLNAFLNSEKYAVFAKFTGGYDYSGFLDSFYDAEEEIAAALGSANDYELYQQIFSYTVDHNTDNANWIVYLDYDITLACQHVYSNACDNTCNLCNAVRTVPDHVYTNACDGNCNVCNTPRVAPHVYDNASDEYCNLCGEKRIDGWMITIADTGVYSITPNQTIANFNKNTITVTDKNGNEVKYNIAKAGWPLVNAQKYVITLNIDYDNTNSLSWNLTKIANTIFTDTVSSENGGWYNDAVNYAVGAGLITGYGGTTKFGTADNIQRQDFVVILARLAGVDLNNYVSSGRYSFADVPKGAYYEKAIMWAADAGITTGYAGGTKFGVGDKITREQLVTFLYRYAKYANGGIAPEVSDNAAANAANYADYMAVTDYAKEPIIWALDNGVIKGQGGTNIAPAGNALRCEVAQIIYNIYLNCIF